MQVLSVSQCSSDEKWPVNDRLSQADCYWGCKNFKTDNDFTDYKVHIYLLGCAHQQNNCNICNCLNNTDHANQACFVLPLIGWNLFSINSINQMKKLFAIQYTSGQTYDTAVGFLLYQWHKLAGKRQAQLGRLLFWGRKFLYVLVFHIYTLDMRNQTSKTTLSCTITDYKQVQSKLNQSYSNIHSQGQ